MSSLKPNEPSIGVCDLSTTDHGQTEQERPSEATSQNCSSDLKLTVPVQHDGSRRSFDTTASQADETVAPVIDPPTPLSARLKLQTDQLHEDRRRENPASATTSISTTDTPQQTVFNAGLPVRNSSIRSVLGSRARRSDSLSPASAISSPALGPLAEMTPLPSPISAWGAPAFGRSSIRSEVDPDATVAGQTRDSSPEPIVFARTSPKKMRIPENLEQTHDAGISGHVRYRSISEYVPEGMQVPRSRNIVVSTSGAPPILPPSLSPPDDDHMHREQYLALQRGLAISIPKPPTPPDSNRGKDSDDTESPSRTPSALKGTPSVLYEAYMVKGGKLKRWKELRSLGKGTFSTVVLGTSEGTDDPEDPCNQFPLEECVSPKSLVAIKICEQGPAGGADEKKMEVSIKREVEIMKCIDHPSLVHLKAVNSLERQTFLVLNYCPGGDLFELANSDIDLLTPNIIRRMFTELVAAVRCLHEQYIVHRDIKLENVLVNLPIAAFHSIGEWQSYPHPVVTLTDLGLGRWIPKPPESPLLDTRCGSEDYAAPEVLIGSEYDGRSTDAWALGVLLYALMEGRLPFDPIPGARRKSPTSHRIARCEWQWVKWADDDGEWDPVKGEKLNCAREIVEGLIARARSRWSLEKVQKTEWVARGMMIDGGLRRVEGDFDED